MESGLKFMKDFWLLWMLAVVNWNAGTRLALGDPDSSTSAEDSSFNQIQQTTARKGLIVSDQLLSEKERQWNQDVAKESVATADRARRFLSQYPHSNFRAAAENIEREELLTAAQAGDQTAQKRLADLLVDALRQPGLGEDARFALRCLQMQNTAASEPADDKKARSVALERGVRALVAEFPTRAEPYSIWLRIAMAQTQDSVAERILSGAQAPDEAKRQARGVLARKHILNHQPHISFKALDDREVDLDHLKGKVVLLDFWATWCGPCVAELPKLKAAYDKFHDQGFEVIGVSFDQNKAALIRFVKERELPWPQFFDGKGWQNRYGTEYGISAIPVMWLINRKGNVVDLNADKNLEVKVEKLLLEKP